MTIRLIGDVHGHFQRYKTIIKNGPPSIQVGDMGVGFRNWPHGEYSANPPYDLMVASDARFIRGNHDNPAVCSSHTQCIADGSVESGVMFVGGGYSIDRDRRIEGYSWWPDEELSHPELGDLVDAYKSNPPRVMITHECPADLGYVLALQGGFANSYKPSRTSQAFQSMWSSHAPELWVFGHYHTSFDQVGGGTRFVCLAELEYRDDLISANEMPTSFKKAA